MTGAFVAVLLAGTMSGCAFDAVPEEEDLGGRGSIGTTALATGDLDRGVVSARLGPADACELQVSVAKEGVYVIARGSVEGPCAGHAYVIIQKLWAGVWWERATGILGGPSRALTVRYDCSGHGPDKYRAKIVYPVVNGEAVKYSNTIDVDC